MSPQSFGTSQPYPTPPFHLALRWLSPPRFPRGRYIRFRGELVGPASFGKCGDSLDALTTSEYSSQLFDAHRNLLADDGRAVGLAQVAAPYALAPTPKPPVNRRRLDC